MSKTAAARTMAITIPHRAETQTRLRSTSRTKKRVKTGSADTRVDSGHHPEGVVVLVPGHERAPPWTTRGGHYPRRVGAVKPEKRHSHH